MTTTWKDALTPTTQPAFRSKILAQSVTNGVDLNGWSAKAPQRALVELDATALAYESSLRAQLAAVASPATVVAAGDDWVDAKIAWFDLDNGVGGKGRIPALKAAWRVPMTCTAAAAPITIDNTSTIQIQAADGTIFESAQSTPVVLNAGSGYAGTVTFTARKAGASGNVTPQSITKVILGPAGLSIASGTQTLSSAGRDAETSTALIQRALGKWSTLGAGWTLPSFDYLIPLFAPTVTGWRVRDDNPLGPGSVLVIMRNAAGPSSGAENAAVLAGLTSSKVRPVGTGLVGVISANPLVVNVAGVVTGDGSNASLSTSCSSTLTTLAAASPIGGDGDGYLRAALLVEALMGGASTKYGLPGFTGSKNVVLTSPVADVAFGLDSVLSFTNALTVNP